jgi:hypothetical protein
LGNGGEGNAGGSDDDGCDATCNGLTQDLVHRYRFDGIGTVVEDSVGQADGTAVNVFLAGTGALLLAGGATDQYVDLPNGIASAFPNATFEVWVTWSGGMPWQRIFDFGTTVSGLEGTQGDGKIFLMLTPLSAEHPAMRLAFGPADLPLQHVVDGSEALPAGVMTHLAGVIDDDSDTMVLYRNGAVVGCADFPDHLSSLEDVNAWLGRSQWARDPAFGGVLHEFRIYRAALTPRQVLTSSRAGPDPAFLTR